MGWKISVVNLTGLLLVFLIGSGTVSSTTYHSLYRDAVNAYNQQRWFECYTLLKKALLDYRTYHQEMAQCWVQCQTEGEAALIDINVKNFLQPLYLDIARTKSECFNKCVENKFPERSSPSAEEVTTTDRDFEDRTPYDYLQISAYKSDQFEDAISAAYTYLATHQGHKYMENNLKFYQSLPEARQSYFRNLEEKYFKVLYSNAVSSYEAEDWLGTILYMEESLQQYYAEEQQCTALCNAPLESSRLNLFLQKISSAPSEENRKRVMLGHWSQILECKERCRAKLDIIDDQPESGSYLKEHYNYLQYSYYKINDIKRAAECTGTYLLIDSHDETAQFNKHYYSKQHEATENDFIARKDAVRYVTSKKSDYSLLATVRNMLSEFSQSVQLDEENEGVMPPVPEEVFGERDSMFLRELDNYKAQIGVTVYAESKELLGNHRVAVDGLISSEQCTKLIELATSGAMQGDGYKGTEAQTSPHTNYEKFEGLTVNRAAELARDGVVSPELAQLYLDVSESGRAFMKKYLNLKTELMFQYTHLVCRTALDVNQSERNDLSHPVHSDNCFIQPDGSCLKRPPAYIYRDFTGLIYLNEEFEGGDFFFAHKNLSLQIALRPKCGRFVGFESDDYHGVMPVTSGRRCALAAWYTLSAAHQELAQFEARTILRSVASPTGTSLVAPPNVQPFLAKRGSHLSMTEEDLNGSQRFAVDDFLTKDQCNLLMKLANLGITSDGYVTARNRLSPHTNHEHFVGVTVSHASMLAAEYKVNAEAVKLYLTVAQDVLELTRLYLTPETPLYFSYTHLVCRTALNENNLDRTDLSHPVHSDNCIIQPDNTCKRERPAYTERDFSAILYLNDNFNGGNFFFTHQNMTVQSSLRPKCGRVVAFNASHYHGVKPVLTGQRCAVALWFTLDASFREPGHEAAWSVIRQLESRAFGPNEHAHLEL